MYWKTTLLATATIIALAISPQRGINPVGINPAYAVCDPGERLDGSTAASARRAMEAAGYSQVRDLKKGCDNYWHAIAMRDGMTMRIVLSPTGEILREGN